MTDFRLYGAALTAAQVSELAAKTVQLDYAFEHGTPGDMTALQTAIAQAQTAVGSAADDCLPGAVANVEDMLMLAQTIVADGTYGQTVLDRMTAQLKAAVTAMKATAGKLFDTSGVEAAGIYDTNRGFRHPGGMHTQQDFDRIKAQLAAGIQPAEKCCLCPARCTGLSCGEHRARRLRRELHQCRPRRDDGLPERPALED